MVGDSRHVTWVSPLTAGKHHVRPLRLSLSESMSSIKRDVKKKAPPRPEGRFLSRDPAHCSFIPLEKFGLWSHSCQFSVRMVAKFECERRGKQDDVNHGSIRGSWPIAISGYPRGHSV